MPLLFPLPLLGCSPVCVAGSPILVTAFVTYFGVVLLPPPAALPAHARAALSRWDTFPAPTPAFGLPALPGPQLPVTPFYLLTAVYLLAYAPPTARTAHYHRLQLPPRYVVQHRLPYPHLVLHTLYSVHIRWFAFGTPGLVWALDLSR